MALNDLTEWVCAVMFVYWQISSYQYLQNNIIWRCKKLDKQDNIYNLNWRKMKQRRRRWKRRRWLVSSTWWCLPRRLILVSQLIRCDKWIWITYSNWELSLLSVLLHEIITSPDFVVLMTCEVFKVFLS